MATEIRYETGFIASNEERGAMVDFAFVTFLWGGILPSFSLFGCSGLVGMTAAGHFENPDTLIIFPGFS